MSWKTQLKMDDFWTTSRSGIKLGGQQRVCYVLDTHGTNITCFELYFAARGEKLSNIFLHEEERQRFVEWHNCLQHDCCIPDMVLNGNFMSKRQGIWLSRSKPFDDPPS
jgi:hypothetical protein